MKWGTRKDKTRHVTIESKACRVTFGKGTHLEPPHLWIGPFGHSMYVIDGATSLEHRLNLASPGEWLVFDGVLMVREAMPPMIDYTEEPYTLEADIGVDVEVVQ